IGVKKSTVCTSACVAEILYTPASSAVSKPTRTLGSCCRANFPSTASSAAGLSLLAQPAALTCSVNRIALVSDIVLILKHRLLSEIPNGVRDRYPQSGISGLFRFAQKPQALPRIIQIYTDQKKFK